MRVHLMSARTLSRVAIQDFGTKRGNMEKEPRTLLDKNWADALKGMAQALQTFKRPSGPLTDFERRLQQVANPPGSKLMKQLPDFSNSPMARQFADMEKNVIIEHACR
jgi:hypothetical protein